MELSEILEATSAIERSDRVRRADYTRYGEAESDARIQELEAENSALREQVQRIREMLVEALGGDILRAALGKVNAITGTRADGYIEKWRYRDARGRALAAARESALYLAQRDELAEFVRFLVIHSGHADETRLAAAAAYRRAFGPHAGGLRAPSEPDAPGTPS